MKKLAKKQTGGSKSSVKKSTGPSFKNPIKPTKDSTNYYAGQEQYYKKASKNLREHELSDASSWKADRLAYKAGENKRRQALKGKPGYDANGFTSKEFLKKGGAVKTKSKK